MSTVVAYGSIENINQAYSRAVALGFSVCVSTTHPLVTSAKRTDRACLILDKCDNCSVNELEAMGKIFTEDRTFRQAFETKQLLDDLYFNASPSQLH